MNRLTLCKSRCFIFILALFFFTGGAYAQGPERLQRPTSPTVSSLGKFGQVEVDYFNGLPRVSVPVYTIKSGNISIPISMMYHASGVKPDQKSGWVGLNWSLNIPFCINRIMNGEPDEKLLSQEMFDIPGATYPFSASYYNHYAVLDRNDWYAFPQLVSYMLAYFPQNANPPQPYGPVRPVPSPDEFTFSFLGYSGSFLLDHKGEWRVKCDAPGGLKVEAIDIFPDVPVTTSPAQLNALGFATSIASLHPGNSYYTNKKRMIKGFTLMDGEGNKYIFGSDENSIEYSRFPFGWPPEDVWGNLTIPVTYYMTKIIPRKGAEIDFEYVKSDYYQFNNNEVWKTMTTSTQGYVTSSSGPGNSIATNIINGSYLNRITFADGYIDFNKSIMNDLENGYNIGGGAYMPYDGFRDIFDQYQGSVNPPKYYKLNSINVYDLNNTLKKKYDLVYEEVSNKRLMLNEIKDMSGSLPVKYMFSYNQDPTKPLPAYNARELDHWGFWNGVNWFQTNYNNISLSSYPSYYNSRQPQLDWAKQGSLDQITYPTGGTTKFTYQLNDYTGLMDYYDGNNSVTFNPNADITYSENSSPEIRPAGGLRIWKIENNFPGLNQTYTTEFDYKRTQSGGNPPKSSGVLAGLPSYIEQGQLWGFGQWWNFFSWQNYNTQPFGLTNGSHITYSQVKEILPGGGYVIRKYTNNDNPLYRDQKYLDKAIGNGNIYRGNMPFSSLSLERGLLEEETYYSNSDVLIKSLKYTYNTSPTKYDDHVRMVDFTVVDINTGFADLTNIPPGWNILQVRNVYSYKKYMYPTLPTKIEETTKSVDGQQPVTTITNIVYNSQKNVKEKSILGSDNKLTKILFKYANDYPSTGTDNISLSINNLRNKNCRNAVIEKIVVKSNADGSNAVVEDAELNFYDINEAVFKKQIKLSQNLSIPYTTAFDSYIGTDHQFHYNSNYDAGPLYEVTLYNTEGNTLQDKDQQGMVNSYIWDNENQLSAVCKGAAYNDIAYTSFESAATGNWSFSGSAAPDPTAPTGGNCYYLPTGNITRSSLTNGITYVISYWSKTGNPYTVNGSSTPSYTGRSVNGWRHYEHEVTSTSITINGNGYIDEVRLFPKGSLMSTSTFDPLIGMTSQCDANNRILYYEYDALGRLILIRDQDKNISKKICYNYAGQPMTCATNCPNPLPPPNWQNTTTALRCQQGPCGNTGYQEQEQRDIEPCSATFEDTRWVVAGYNPTACPIPNCVNLTSTFVTTVMTGYTASYYNTSTGTTYNLPVPAAAGLQPLGIIPAGPYTLTISRTSGVPIYGTFKSGCKFQVITGTSAVFTNVNVSATTCNSISIDLSAN